MKFLSTESGYNMTNHRAPKDSSSKDLGCTKQQFVGANLLAIGICFNFLFKHLIYDIYLFYIPVRACNSF